MKHYLIYKITNNLNGKFYIGKHITENIDDGYMGSGVAIKRAIKKYGVENFTKEILFDVYGEDMMNFLEEAIVDEAFVKRKDTYNMMTGGMGGHVLEVSEETRRKISKVNKGKIISPEHRAAISEKLTGRKHSKEWCEHIGKGRKGKLHSEETKRKLSEHTILQMTKEAREHISRIMKERNPNRGKHLSEEQKILISKANKGKHRSSEFKKRMSEMHKGLHWFNNGSISKQAKECPEGFVPGRLRKVS